MYKNSNLVFILALFALASFTFGHDAGFASDDFPAPSLDQKDQNDSGVEQMTTEGDNETPMAESDSEVSGGEEHQTQDQELGDEEGEGQAPAAEETQNADDQENDGSSQPLPNDANEAPKEEQPVENAGPLESGNSAVPIEGAASEVEQHPEDVKSSAEEKKPEDAATPNVEEAAPKGEEKVEEKPAEETKVEEPEKKEEDKVEGEEEEKPKTLDSAEHKADNSTAPIEAVAATNATTNSTAPATKDGNKPSIWTRIMCLFIHWGCPSAKSTDQKAGNRTESATRGIRAQGIVFIGGGAADSSSESEEEELGSAEKDHDLSVETAADEKNDEKKEDGEKAEKAPEAEPAADGEKEEGKEENNIKIKGSFNFGATMVHSEVDSDGIQRSNITQINAEMEN